MPPLAARVEAHDEVMALLRLRDSMRLSERTAVRAGT